MTGEIPSSLASLTNLETLTLHHNQLSGPIPPSLGTLTNLEELYLASSQLTGEIPSSLASLTNLRNLILYDNELSGSLPPWLGTLTNLEELRLDGNPLTGPFPVSWTALSLDTLWLDVCIPPLHEAWVQTILDFQGTVCGALPHLPGIRASPWRDRLRRGQPW